MLILTEKNLNRTNCDSVKKLLHLHHINSYKISATFESKQKICRNKICAGILFLEDCIIVIDHKKVGF